MDFEPTRKESMDHTFNLINEVVNDLDGDAELIYINSKPVITCNPEMINKYKEEK